MLNNYTRHWQLRSLLCSPSTDALYYPSNNCIYHLNTATKKRRLVASLPFSPRCIGARYGWVCAGGAENGHIATIRLPESREDEFSASGADLPESTSRQLPSDGQQRPAATLNITIIELGGLIVNSVTLYRPPNSMSDDDVFAVLTNNDKTVRIFHLGQNRVVTTLNVDVSTNHATISPDGQHLVVVGDSTEVYFYHPANSGVIPDEMPNTGIGEESCGSWIPSLNPPLKAGAETDTLMSTSFSPSSLLCAVASQLGIITIFDTRYLSHSNIDGISPLVKVISSSRPFTESGAIRSVQFSPAPWDLLVWAEHCGRVCVTDVRTNFTKRQIVNLSVEKDEIIEAEIEEARVSPSAREISPNVLGNPSINRSPLHEGTSIEDSSEARQDSSQSPSINVLADLVLENTSDWLASRIRGLVRAEFSGSSSQSSLNVRTGNPTSPTLLRNYRERQIERDRARQRIQDPPRRRNSIHASYIEQLSPNIRNRASSIVNPLPASRDDQDRMIMSRTEGLVSGPSEQVGISNVNSQNRRRRHLGIIEVETNQLSIHSMESGDVDITGCTLSPDGRKLFVATDGGVVEYIMDVKRRKLFPSITPR